MKGVLIVREARDRLLDLGWCHLNGRSQEAVPRLSMRRTPVIKSTSWDVQLDNPNNFKK